MKVTSMISSTYLAIDTDYEVLDEVITLKKTYYKIKAETGEEIYSRADNFIKVKEVVSIVHEGHLYTFGESSTEVEYLGNVNPFKRVGANDE